MRSNLHRLHAESSAAAPLKGSNSRGGGAHQWWRPSVGLLLLWAHCLGLACSVFVLAWVLRFRGGLPFIAHNPALADHNDVIFNAHPFLMLVGYIVLASEAILVFKGVQGTKSYKKAVHLTLQGLAFWMAVLGIWAALKFHNAKGIDNFYSLHSWLGIITVILFGLQWICAYVIYWYPGAVGKTRASVLPWHVFMGLFIYCMALVTAETGLLEKLTFLMINKVIGRFSLEAMFVNSIGMLLIVYGAVVILASVPPRAS
eukprot:c29667_g1_i1 orf=453-1226(-)